MRLELERIALLAKNSLSERSPLLSVSSSSNNFSQSCFTIHLVNVICSMNSARLITWSLFLSASLIKIQGIINCLWTGIQVPNALVQNDPFLNFCSDFGGYWATYIKLFESIDKIRWIPDGHFRPKLWIAKNSISIDVKFIKHCIPAVISDIFAQIHVTDKFSAA